MGVALPVAEAEHLGLNRRTVARPADLLLDVNGFVQVVPDERVGLYGRPRLVARAQDVLERHGHVQEAER